MLLLLATSALAQDEDDASLEALRALGYLSASPGGAQDAALFADQVRAAGVPLPETLTAEGLFGQNDLPLDGRGACPDLLCPVVAAMPAHLLGQPDATWIAQLGFDSALTAESFSRAPMHLVAVVDKSGSMSGEPLETVKASLRELVEHQLGPDDLLSIVLYGDVVETRLAPTRGNETEMLLRVIDGITSAGSTNMEAGLERGFSLARSTRFAGNRRVMLFTDERPNVGATAATSFMTMAREASRNGIGLTTIGVGVQFDAELGAAVSAVRGGNLFYFPSVPDMRATFGREFDTLVTEIAHDLELVVRPAPGLRVTGVYGVPGELVRWTPDGNLAVTVETLFLSRQEGAIYLTFGPEGTLPPSGTAIGSVDLSFTPVDGAGVCQSLDIAPEPTPGLGLVRGHALVDQYLALKAATTAYHQGDAEGAWRLVHALAGSQAGEEDPELAEERAMITQLEATLARLAGRQGEVASAR